MSDARTLAVYAARGDDYAAMMDREAERDPIIARFIAACRPGARVLDLGCGTGHYAARMAAAGLAVDAMDAVPEMARRAAALPGVTARTARFEELDARQAYDGIWCYFSLLHAPRADFPAHLRRISDALRPGGTLFLGMKRGTGGGRDRLGRYYEYYERPELEAQLRDADLTPAEHWYGEGAGLAAHPEGWVVIAAHA